MTGAAIVTGGGRGIGRAIGAALAERGHDVVLADLDIDAATASAEALGPRVTAARLDVTDADAVTALVEATAARHGRLAWMVNNAGVGVAGAFDATGLDDWRRAIDVNLFGVVHGCRAALAVMRPAGGGHIVNIASGAGLAPRPGMVAYAAAKHAVVGLSTSLRAEAALDGVTVHAVCPGYVETGIMDRTAWRGVDGAKVVAGIPIRGVTPEKCASVVLRGVRRDRAIIPVTAVTHLEWRLYRFAPWLLGPVFRARARVFRRHASDASDAP